MNAWFKRIALLLAAFFVALGAVAFFLENQTTIVLGFIGWKTPELPVSFFVLLAFSGGGAIGVLLGQIFAMRYRAKLVVVRKELARSRTVLDGNNHHSSK